VKLLSLSLTDGAASDILEQADWYEQRADARLSSRWERPSINLYFDSCGIHVQDHYAFSIHQNYTRFEEYLFLIFPSI
jgi:hypothetical protein